jgi:site-specific DNA-methyltransferase (adenine-specific)
MNKIVPMDSETFEIDYETKRVGRSLVVHADCLEWLGRIPENSLHAIVTDPPYGVREYDFDQLEKRENGSGGVWRIPPSFDGNERSPLPRFSNMSNKEKDRLRRFFKEWAQLASRALRPGAHVFVATNTALAPLVYNAIDSGGIEYRGQIIRGDYITLRGGDRPKGAHEEFENVCTMPRGTYEPWGLFRNPIPRDLRIQDCLRKFGTGGLRRKPDGRPFMDTISCGKTPKQERDIADHSSLKPQKLLRQLVYASLPLEEGIVCDPFMGSGSTIAAANALGYDAIGVERLIKHFEDAPRKINALSELSMESEQLELI